MAESGSLTVYPGAYDRSNVSNASHIYDEANFVGKNTSNTKYARVYSYNGSDYAFWPFDTSSIPELAKIVSVSCRVKAQKASASGVTCKLRLFSGSTAKGTATTVNKTTATIFTLDAGTWTREEVSSIRLRTGITAGSDGSYFWLYGAELTIEYTYNRRRFMLKLSGDYEDVARTFKKVNGIWVEQTELANVVDQTKRLVNGGEYVVELPEGYTRLEYIESTGSQYIDTGVVGTANTRIKMRVQFLNTSDQILCGTVDNSGGIAEIPFLFGGKFYFCYGSSTYTILSADTNVHEIECTQGNLLLDGESHALTGAATFQYPFYLFARNEKGSGAGYLSTARIYDCKFYENGIIVRYYVPCRNPSGVVGLYDAANGSFYGSASATGFAAPGDVPVISLISFNINAVNYQAEEGMTWGAWCNSNYNTGGFTVSGNYVYFSGMANRVANSSRQYVSPSDVIQADAYYDPM